MTKEEKDRAISIADAAERLTPDKQAAVIHYINGYADGVASMKDEKEEEQCRE